MASSFQVQLAGEWKNYSRQEDRVLKTAFYAGQPCAKYRLRGQMYQVSFARPMQQRNLTTGRARAIRPPHKARAPATPLVPAGPTRFVTVPKGHEGTTLHVKDKGGRTLEVQLDKAPKPGQTVAIPMGPPPAAEAGVKGKDGKSGWSTGAKVAATTAGVVGAGALVAGGVVLAETTDIGDWAADAAADAGEWAEGAGEWVADAAEDAGEWVVGAGEDAGEWLGDAAEDVGDFFMDLF